MDYLLIQMYDKVFKCVHMFTDVYLFANCEINGRFPFSRNGRFVNYIVEYQILRLSVDETNICVVASKRHQKKILSQFQPNRAVL